MLTHKLQLAVAQLAGDREWQCGRLKMHPIWCASGCGGMTYKLDMQARMAMTWLLQQQRQLPHPVAAGLRSLTLEATAMASTTRAVLLVLAVQTLDPTSTMAATLEAIRVSSKSKTFVMLFLGFHIMPSPSVDPCVAFAVCLG